MHRMIEDRADWRGPDIVHSPLWIHEFTKSEVGEIDTAFRHAKGAGKTVATLTREDFPLPTVRHVLAHALDELESGLGLYHLRGLPTAPYSKDDLRLIYWGLGKHLGTAVSQSRDGDLLGDVRDIGVDIYSPKGRGYRSKQKLSCHTDTCDVVGLMVLRTAMSGGLSVLASSIAIHNEIARRRPDLLEVLYQPFWWSWQGQEPPGDKPYYPEPVFTFHHGKFACRYVRSVILSGQRFPEVPRMTKEQEEAMALIDELGNSDRFHFTMMFQPGDIQLVNNHTILHARTSFEDFPEEDRKRHLLRMWLSVPNSRQLSPDFRTIYRDISAGAVRGGYPSRTGKYTYESPQLVD
ncbi:MAG: TauD/TfdA family dioxygenase [Xanthobacteraceae bacterium]